MLPSAIGKSSWTCRSHGHVKVTIPVLCFALDSAQIPLFPPLPKGEQGGFAGNMFNDCIAGKISAHHTTMTKIWTAAEGPFSAACQSEY